MKKFKFADEVSFRMIQIFQEAVLFGEDGADLMRQVRLVVDESDEDVLVLDSEYMEAVVAKHNALLDKVAKMQLEEESKLSVTKEKN